MAPRSDAMLAVLSVEPLLQTIIRSTTGVHWCCSEELHGAPDSDGFEGDWLSAVEVTRLAHTEHTLSAKSSSITRPIDSSSFSAGITTVISLCLYIGVIHWPQTRAFNLVGRSSENRNGSI